MKDFRKEVFILLRKATVVEEQIGSIHQGFDVDAVRFRQGLHYGFNNKELAEIISRRRHSSNILGASAKMGRFVTDFKATMPFFRIDPVGDTSRVRLLVVFFTFFWWEYG